MTTTKTRLDKRLRSAKVIGIILFILSIVSFASNVGGGLMSLLIMPDLNRVLDQDTIFSGPIDWLFRHFTVCAFSFSLIWIPLFFSARALYRFKEWGRIMSIIMLFLLMIVLAGMAYAFFGITFAPLFMRIGWVLMFIVYILVLVVAVYFLMKKSLREGIRDYNLKAHTSTFDTAE